MYSIWAICVGQWPDICDNIEHWLDFIGITNDYYQRSIARCLRHSPAEVEACFEKLSILWGQVRGRARKDVFCIDSVDSAYRAHQYACADYCDNGGRHDFYKKQTTNCYWCYTIIETTNRICSWKMVQNYLYWNKIADWLVKLVIGRIYTIRNKCVTYRKYLLHCIWEKYH